MADALAKLRTALETDQGARTKFAEGLKRLIKDQGLDPNDLQTLKALGIKDMDVTKANFAKDVGDSTVVVTIVY